MMIESPSGLLKLSCTAMKPARFEPRTPGQHGLFVPSVPVQPAVVPGAAKPWP
jgi:hypothetical protein